MRLFVVSTLWIMSCMWTCGLAHAQELLPADKPINEVIDHYIGAEHNRLSIPVAPLADDYLLVRRTTLDLVGRIPTTKELLDFVNSEDANKREVLVDRLMASKEYREHQADTLNIVLANGRNENLRPFLLDAIEKNVGWSEIFRQLVVGDMIDGTKQEAGDFVKSRVSDTDALTNETSVLFFGVNISCAKCHDHPLVTEWTQAHFYGMKSFFSRTFDNGGFIAEREYGAIEYKTTSGEAKNAELMFLSGTVMSEPEWTKPTDEEAKAEKAQLEQLKKDKKKVPRPQFSRREQLVDVALKEEKAYFSKAMVNRTWFRFVGRGFVMPLDQMHPENTPTHPELLDWLARDTRDNGYDLSRLIRGIVLSDAYARDSRWDSQEKRPDSMWFSVGNVRILSPLQYASSMKIGARNPVDFSGDDAEVILKNIENTRQQAKGFSSKIEIPGDDFQVSVGEALLFSNNVDFENTFLRDGAGDLVGAMIRNESNEAAVDMAAMAIFNRQLEDDERKAMLAFLETRSENRADAIKHLVWAMLASGEVRFNY